LSLKVFPYNIYYLKKIQTTKFLLLHFCTIKEVATLLKRD
jgi:hypothetical protein